MDHGTAVRVQVDGLPALLVSGERMPAEPSVGIFEESIDGLDWVGAEGELTPEQEVACVERMDAIESELLSVLAERRRAAMEGDAAGEVYLRAAGGW
jgi:hypothetical protein